MFYSRLSKKSISFLLILVLLLVPLAASSSSLGELSDAIGQQVTCDNIMPSPAFLLGAEGVLASTDLSLGDTLFDAYAYPLVESPAEFWQTYTLWLNHSGYTVQGPYTIDSFEAYALVDASGLYAFFIPEFSTMSLMLIPAGLTVGPLVLPDPADYCTGSISTYKSNRMLDSDDAWLFFSPSEYNGFDQKAYVLELENEYGFSFLDSSYGAPTTDEYTHILHLSLPGSQAGTITYHGPTCHMVVRTHGIHIGDSTYQSASFGFSSTAVGLAIAGYDELFYTISKGYAAQSQSSVGDISGTSTTSSGASASSSKTSCSTCHGSGKKDCSKCRGDGKVTCTACDGKGGKDVYISTPNYSGSSKTSSTKWENCSKCSGTGNQSCRTCSGMGHVACTSCSGTGYN